MKGNLEDLLRERFQGHEAPVDPGVWDSIKGQLAQAAPAADPVNELFRERFAGHESPVDPTVWQGISKQLGHAPVGVGTWGWAAAVGGVLIAGTALWFSVTPTTVPTPVAEVSVAPVSVAPPIPSSAPVAAPAEVLMVTPDRNAPSASARPTSSDVSSTPSRNSAATVDEPPVSNTVTTASVPVVNEMDKADAVSPTTAPLLVEEIIQQITERTVNEVRTHPEGSPEGADGQVIKDLDPTLGSETPEIFLPNTFTPNGDRVNDVYEVDQEGFRSMLIRVLALKNDKLVFSTNTGEPWTGDGCEDGMYVVVVEAITMDGLPVSKAKVVWLNRDRVN